MLSETTTQPQDDGTQGTATPDTGTEGVSEDGATGGASPENVQPGEGQDQTPPADDVVFHEEGNRKFKTKDEYVSWVNQQRGASARLAGEASQAKAKAAELAQALEQANAVIKKFTGEDGTGARAPVDPEDPEVQAAIAKLRKHGVLTKEDASSLEQRLSKIEQASQQESQKTAQRMVEEFFQANPDAHDRVTEMQELIEKKQLSLDEAYLIVFQKPAQKSKNETARDAYERGKITQVKKAQAGASPKGVANPAAANGQFLDWSKLNS